MQQPVADMINQIAQAQLAIGYRLDQYEIEALLAVGDFRISYYAWDHQKNRNVVIQEYFPRSLAIRQADGIGVTSENADRFTDYEFGLSEFLLESRLVSQIHSAYLPVIIEYREANGTGYLISEYDDGKTLREIIDSDSGFVSENQIKEILRAGLQGLRELHARNLLHTSVSPLNLFIRFHGHPIVLGQGLARYRLAQYTKTWDVIQNQGYTPLEQYSLDGNIGPWSDLYALGASLYECITGVRPVDASSRHTALIKGDEDPLTPAAEIGQGRYSTLLLSNIDWMLKPSIEDRPDSADLMLGVVSFQRQSESIKHKPAGFTNGSNRETGAHPQGLARARHQSTTDVQVEPEIQHQGPSRYLIGGLGLLVAIFLTISGYQIYKHEYKIREILVEQQPLPVGPLAEPDAGLLAPPVTRPETTENLQGADREISRQSDEQRRGFYENLVKEEEIERRVEEQLSEKLQQQLQELESEQAQQQQAEVEKRQQQIYTLLEQADTARQKNILYQPDGLGAAGYYRQVLALEPGNEIAQQGVSEIADHYYRLAMAAIEDKSLIAASENLRFLIAVQPDHPNLDQLVQQIADLKTELQVAEIQQTSSELNQALPQIENPENPLSLEPDNVPPPSEPDSSEPEIQSAPPVVVNRSQLSNDYARYDRGDYTTDLFDKMRLAAESGNSRAQYILSEMYAAGRGVSQNLDESTYWLKRSLDYVEQHARYGQPWAEKAMGVIYEKGWFVDASPESAVSWYRKAADKGYAPAQYRLGLAYARGLGVRKNNQTAREWFKKALSNGNLEAKKALSKLPVQN